MTEMNGHMELEGYEKEHLDRVRRAMPECMVLLKKDGSFPLDSPGSIAAYGSGVRHSVKGGTGSGEVNSRFFITVEQGLKDAGFEVTTAEWLDSYDRELEKARSRFAGQLRAEAKAAGMSPLLYGIGAVMPEPEYDIPLSAEAGAAIYVVSRNSGEGNDRRPVPGDVMLTASEIRDILELDGRYGRFMLVINSGGVVDLSPVKDVGNILILSQLGAETGRALADVILGKTVPSGKLSTTWSSWDDYCPDIEFGGRDETLYREGIYVGYRYFDTVGRKALFPFGYGLSYTEFSFSGAEADISGTEITVSADITDTGGRPGKEVMQVYVTAPEGRLRKPYQELAGFVKTSELAPGETERVSVSFRMEDIASFCEEDEAYILEKGRYIIRAGSSSADSIAVAAVELDGDVTVKKVRSICGEPGFTDPVYERTEREEIKDIPVLRISSDAFITQTAEYESETEIFPEIAGLSDKELAALCTGNHRGGGLSSVIGGAAKNVPGDAGETAWGFESRGIPSISMADGPAGLRLADSYYTDRKGKHPVVSQLLPEGMLANFGRFPRKMYELITGSGRIPKGAKVEHQYCTAIPIGTAVAQSWNTDLAAELGDIVGSEMERFGVDLWLAPAMNIHRSILCGRNYEYYSEDPLLSGKIAAAVTRGVQSHRGKGVTIKHFAANNQELNRYTSDSRMSERTLREIYLRGFAICVGEADPAAVMTSYNLVNGIHTAESYALIEDYLRHENGFDGMVMTDWIVSVMAGKGYRNRNTLSDEVMLAGGDLFMPGSAADLARVLKAIRSGKIPRHRMEINATRVLRAIRRCRDL